jgi:hypothetical protein
MISKIDPLSDFFELAAARAAEIVRTFKGEYDHLVAIDDVFVRIQENLYNSKDWFSGLFFLRCHSAWRAAIRLAISGQTTESYVVLRSAIENSLYALYLSRNRSSTETWLSRDESPETLQKVKDEFKISNLLKLLESIDPENHKIAKGLYDRTIDSGGHPNPLALMSNMRIHKTDERISFDQAYLSRDVLSVRACLKSGAQVAICCLSICRNIYRERYDILGITQQLLQLGQVV